ncbi:MAG: RNA polymerase sporulation sigma factor SigH [Acetatifactor sp.]|nr:RNA polymerase sporulation sigma factor SigH [Acetatifactor sp.]
MSERFSEYASFTDDELLDRLRHGEAEVEDYICEKYKNLVRSKAKSMFILGADNEDLIQEGMIGLFKAVRDYDCGRDASFYTFAELCISRQMYTAVQAAKRKKHFPLNSSISLDSPQSVEAGDEQESMSLGRLLTAKVGMNPEEMVLDRERTEYLEKAIEEELSEFERQVLDLYVTGMPTSQIAKVLGRNEKATDNALQRLKAKIKKIITKGES